MVLSQCDSPYVTKYFGSYLKVNNPLLCIASFYFIDCCFAGNKAMDHHGVPGGRVGSGPDEGWEPG